MCWEKRPKNEKTYQFAKKTAAVFAGNAVEPQVYPAAISPAAENWKKNGSAALIFPVYD